MSVGAILDRLELLKAEPGDVVVLHDADALADHPDTPMMLADAAKRLDVMFVCLPTGVTLEQLTPAQLTKLGWARADTITQVVTMGDPDDVELA